MSTCTSLLHSEQLFLAAVMEQTYSPLLDQTDLEKLLTCFDVEAVIEHLSSKGFLSHHELSYFKHLSKRRDIVLYLHHILKADSSRFSIFLVEFEIFMKEHLSHKLYHIQELKTRTRSRNQTRTDTDHCSEPDSEPSLLKLKPEEIKPATSLEETEYPSDAFEHVSI